MSRYEQPLVHPLLNPNLARRTALQAGSISLLGLGMADVLALRSLAGAGPASPARSVIFIFLTGGLSHQDSFDLKPDAPDSVRGEFQPIETRTPGIAICEHLPLLSQQSERYTLVRSVSTNSSGHEEACHMLLTGRLDFPPGFSLNRVPSLNEWPSLASQVTYALGGKSKLPPAVVLPQPSINESGRVRPGQFAGRLGPRHEAWHLNVASQCPLGNGACPNCFRHDEDTFSHAADQILDMPALALPDGGGPRLRSRLGLLGFVEDQQQELERLAEFEKFDRYQRQALSVLTDPRIQHSFEVEKAGERVLERYGKNKFGLSLLMANRLTEAGVSLVQVNLGKNSSWDTHRRNFHNLRENLLPYMDRAVSALLGDLASSGRLGETLVVMTGEFGRTPKINKSAGRDHWGPANSVLLAGGGVRGGQVIGSTDKIAAYPTSDRQTPENLAATVYQTLGIPSTTIWKDVDDRPHELYRGEPIRGLM